MHRLAMFRRVALAIALSLMAGVAPAAAQRGAKAHPMDLNVYSLRFWPHNTLQRGQTVRAKTPYGILTCRSTGLNAPRQCSLQ